MLYRKIVADRWLRSWLCFSFCFWEQEADLSRRGALKNALLWREGFGRCLHHQSSGAGKSVAARSCTYQATADDHSSMLRKSCFSWLLYECPNLAFISFRFVMGKEGCLLPADPGHVPYITGVFQRNEPLVQTH